MFAFNATSPAMMVHLIENETKINSCRIYILNAVSRFPRVFLGAVVPLFDGDREEMTGNVWKRDEEMFSSQNWTRVPCVTAWCLSLLSQGQDPMSSLHLMHNYPLTCLFTVHPSSLRLPGLWPTSPLEPLSRPRLWCSPVRIWGHPISCFLAELYLTYWSCEWPVLSWIWMAFFLHQHYCTQGRRLLTQGRRAFLTNK